MRIRHGELEECLSDPQKWVAAKLAPTGGGPRAGYDHCLREGLYRFHKTEDVAAARLYIERTATNRGLVNRLRVEQLQVRFDTYIQWYESSGVVVADHRSQLDFDLDSGLILGGTVSRVDITSDGYRAILLGLRKPSWQQETRMPLIQRAMATRYERPEDEISVGYQNLDGGELDVVTYSQSVLNEAENLARQLALTVAIEVAAFGA